MVSKVEEEVEEEFRKTAAAKVRQTKCHGDPGLGATGILGQVTYTLHAVQPAVCRVLPSKHNHTVGVVFFPQRGSREVKTRRKNKERLSKVSKPK